MQRLLAERDVDVPLRTLQRVLAPHRQARRAAELATVRFETPPGYQLQIDFGEKWIEIAGLGLIHSRRRIAYAAIRSADLPRGRGPFPARN